MADQLRPTLGPLVCRWIEACCVLGEGDYYGQPVRLRRWQKAIIYQLYEVWPPGHPMEGRRVYRRALIGVAKGNGKTPLASWIASAELGGPVIFDGWARNGSPRGRMRTSPVVPIGAASFDQADLVFSELKNTWRESPRLSGHAEVFDTEILLTDSPGRAYRIAAARATNDGGRPTCFVCDEFHEWTTPAQEGAHLVMSNGTAKREDSLQLAITTAGADLESLCGRQYTRGKQIAAGEVDDPTFLFVWYEADEDLDPTDPDDIRRGIRQASPAADDFLNVEETAAQFVQIPVFEAIRYFWNRFSKAGASWLPAGSWKACQDHEALGADGPPDGTPVVAAIDAALFHDSTACVLAWQLEDGRTAVWLDRIWEPTPEDPTDLARVGDHIRALAERVQLLAVAYDPNPFEVVALQLDTDGYPMEKFPQSAERMEPACRDAYDLIVNHRLVHAGQTVLTDHVESAAIRESARGWRLDKARSTRLIDAAVAMVMATATLRRHQPEEEIEPMVFRL